MKGKVRATSCKVIWNPPDDTGGSPVTSYELEMDGGAGYQSVYRGEATEFLFDELQPGTTYRWVQCHFRDHLSPAPQKITSFKICFGKKTSKNFSKSFPRSRLT